MITINYVLSETSKCFTLLSCNDVCKGGKFFVYRETEVWHFLNWDREAPWRFRSVPSSFLRVSYSLSETHPSRDAFFPIPVLHALPIRFLSSEIKYTAEHPFSGNHTLLLVEAASKKCLFRRMEYVASHDSCTRSTFQWKYFSRFQSNNNRKIVVNCTSLLIFYVRKQIFH